MKMTSAQAAKVLRKFNDELSSVSNNEAVSNTFLAAVGEDPESVRPEYDYEECQKKKEELEIKIRKLKHSINVFNSTYVIPDFNITIDEMLVYLPQLSTRIGRLASMKDRLPKVRENSRIAGGGNGSIIDYRYTNYDVKKAAKDYEILSDELARAQTALDLANSTVEFDFCVE